MKILNVFFCPFDVQMGLEGCEKSWTKVICFLAEILRETYWIKK